MIEEDTREWVGNQGTRMSDDFKEYLSKEEFNPLHGNERFQKLYE
jgi:hypothetical protein